jgi:gamma-glutamyltranspeptidase/glutathione hydrolase
MPMLGWESVTVPGAVSAWVKLSDRFGKLEFATVRTSHPLRRTGFPVSPVIATLWNRAAGLLGDQPGFAETFLPARPRPRAGEYFSSPGHARTLRLIAETRGKAFYEGIIAEEIAAYAKGP